MKNTIITLQLAVFALVTASFTNIYLTQPILPILQKEFMVSTVEVSQTVSAVILGIVLSNLFFGYLSDRIGIHPIIMVGGLCVAAGGMTCALTHNFHLLIAARLVQGLFIPALTTSLAAWLARALPAQRLNVIMGAYVSATVLGGLGGRLLGGWIHPPLHWRYAFLSAAALIVVTTILAVLILPKTEADLPKSRNQSQEYGYLSLMKRKDLLLIFCCGAGGLMIFSPVFNYLPYRLANPPFNYSTEFITLIYLVYIVGIFLGPMVGKLSNLIGSGTMLIGGTAILGLSLGLLLTSSIAAVMAGLLGVCAGFFTVHAVAVGLLNRKLSGGHGKANALYVLFYYSGGWLGINLAGFGYEYAAWNGVIGFVLCCLSIPLTAGIMERYKENHDTATSLPIQKNSSLPG